MACSSNIVLVDLHLAMSDVVKKRFKKPVCICIGACGRLDRGDGSCPDGIIVSQSCEGGSLVSDSPCVDTSAGDT